VKAGGESLKKRNMENLISVKELAALNKEDLLKKATELHALATEQNATIADMNEQMEVLAAEKEEAKSNTIFITYGKKRYKVLASVFMLKGMRYSASDLKENETLVKEVLEVKNQQILTATK
jgi:hypothetical protein